MFLNFIIKCCQYMSMMKNNSVSRIFGVYMIIGPSLSLVGIILSLAKTNKIRYLTQILGFVFCFLFGLSHQLLFLTRRQLLQRIISRISSTHPHFPNFIDKNVTQAAEKKAEESSMIEITFFVFSSSCWAFCPYLYLITKPGMSLDHPDIQIVPYFYDIWSTKSIPSFLFKKCFEISISATGLLAYYIFTIFVTYIIANLEAHIEEINCQLRTVIKQNVKKYMQYNEFSISRTQKDGCFVSMHANQKRKQYENSFDQHFVKIITYHNFIHSYVAEVIKILHRPMTVVFAWYISSTVLFAYAFLDVPDDIVYLMKMVTLVVHCHTSLRKFCKIAETIYEMNEKIKYSFYNTSWYYLLPKSRKNFAIILTLCQRKYQVKSFGMYIVNLNLFIFAVRIVYSVMNVVIVMQSKK